MKWILQQLLGRKKKINKIVKLRVRERKNLAHWKATKFRFCLHYVGSIVFHEILPKNLYRNFLLLVAACRILCDPEKAIDKVNYAQKLLKTFFELLPSLYGADSQVMNSHNLIHIADDASYLGMNLASFSAFPFENELGKIIRMIKGRSNPIGQLFRRISEQKSCPVISKRKQVCRRENLITNPDSDVENVELQSIFLCGVKLTSSKPDNIVYLNSSQVFEIKNIRKVSGNVMILGHLFKTITDVFKYPCESL